MGFLFDMTPCSTLRDRQNVDVGNAKPPREVCRGRPRLPEASYLADAVLCEFGQAIPLAPGETLRPPACRTVVARWRPSLPCLVEHVVGRCAKKKMCRVDACLIVAVMAHEKAMRYRAVSQNPRDAVGAAFAINPSGCPAITPGGAAERAGPQPTSGVRLRRDAVLEARTLLACGHWPSYHGGHHSK